jgi:hypothetical protein
VCRLSSCVVAVAMVVMVAALAHCAWDGDFECDRMGAAIVLPAPGDTITLRGRACIEGATGSVPMVGVVVDGEGHGTAMVRLSVMDPVNGTEVADPEFSGIGLAFTPSHCDEGFVITIESTASEPLTAWVWIGAEAEKYDRCDVYLGAP